MQFGFAGAWLGCQQATQARLGPGRSFRRCPVGGFGFFQLPGVAALHPDIGQANLGLGVAQVCQHLVVLLRGGDIAALERFIGQALIGQAGTAGQGDGQQT